MKSAEEWAKKLLDEGATVGCVNPDCECAEECEVAVAFVRQVQEDALRAVHAILVEVSPFRKSEVLGRIRALIPQPETREHDGMAHSGGEHGLGRADGSQRG